VKTITIRVSSVEAIMLAKLVRFNKKYRNVEALLLSLPHQEYACLTGRRGWE